MVGKFSEARLFFRVRASRGKEWKSEIESTAVLVGEEEPPKELTEIE